MLKVEHEILELRTRHPFHIARAAAPPARRSVWVRVQGADGREGWGEAAATAFYGETAETVTALLPRLAAELAEAVGDDPFALERAERALASSIGYSPAARVALSAALHDLVGKHLELPVWRLWGLDPAAAPASSFTIGIDEPEAMRAKLREAASYPILKIKVGTERDEEVLGIIRDEAPDARLWVDANTAWTATQAIGKLPMLEAYRVELLEQPLRPGDLDGFRLLHEHSRIPIIADESCKVAADLPRLVGRVAGINIKLAKCGSLREALRLVQVARAHDLQVMLGCMVESTLGIAAAVQLAPLVDYVDLDGAALLANDPFRGPGIEPDGRLRFNASPGLGVERE
jgi:L-alanine-DL-glutamate epimerase-like enolase superfamily enzyme